VDIVGEYGRDEAFEVIKAGLSDYNKYFGQ
jgi:hypothetical protein